MANTTRTRTSARSKASEPAASEIEETSVGRPSASGARVSSRKAKGASALNGQASAPVDRSQPMDAVDGMMSLAQALPRFITGTAVVRRGVDESADPQAFDPDLARLSEPAETGDDDAASSAAKSSGPDLSTKSRLEAGRAKIQARADKARALAEQRQLDSAFDKMVLQSSFPFWDDEHRGVPNPFIRSGLFSVQTGEDRDYLQSMVVSSLSNYKISYSGQELRQDDLSVWMALINMARDQNISDMVMFSAYSLIKDLGWRMHSDSYQQIKESIMRLKVTSLSIGVNGGKTAYAGSLIRDYAFDEKTASGNPRWMVRFEPKISMLFMTDTTSMVEWEARKKIGRRSSLALWLHNFYASHRNPLPYSMGKLHEISGAKTTLSTFRRNARLSLQKLKEVGFLRDFSVEQDMVYVTKARASKADSQALLAG